jgi:hypothetical protein
VNIAVVSQQNSQRIIQVPVAVQRASADYHAWFLGLQV